MTARLGLRTIGLGYLALLLVLPVGLIFYRTFEHGIAPAWNAVTSPDALHAFWLTLEIAAIAVMLNTLFGVACALLLARRGTGGGRAAARRPRRRGC